MNKHAEPLMIDGISDRPKSANSIMAELQINGRISANDAYNHGLMPKPHVLSELDALKTEIEGLKYRIAQLEAQSHSERQKLSVLWNRTFE